MRLFAAFAAFAASFAALAVSAPPIDGPAAVCLRPDPDRVRAHDHGVTLTIGNECVAPLLVRIHSSRGAREILVRSHHPQRSLQGGFACQYYHREPPTCERIEAFLAPFARSDLLGAFGIADEATYEGFMTLTPPLEASLAATASEFFQSGPATTEARPSSRPPGPAPAKAPSQGNSDRVATAPAGASSGTPNATSPRSASTSTSQHPGQPESASDVDQEERKWVCDVPFGQGKCVNLGQSNWWRNARYTGEVKAGLPDGLGISTGLVGLVRPRDTATRYEGQWRSGSPHGQGRFTLKGVENSQFDSDRVGTWSHGKFVAP